VTVLYLRISQDTTGLELGVDRQEETCRALCDRNDWPIVGVIRDNSVSATRAKPRPGFEELIALHPKRIVMWSVDRLVRKGPDLERLIELDIPIHSVAAGPMDLSTASGRLNARLLTSVATFEGEIKSERQRAANLQRAQMGRSWWPRRPFGYELDGSLREAEAAALRRAYADLLQGVPVSTIAKSLTRDGQLTNSGNPWSQPSLRVVLANARNAAIRVYRGDEIGPAKWQAIVPEDTFRAAARLLASPGRSTGGGGARVNLLTGILRCHVCKGDSRMQWVGRKGEPGSYGIYECRAGYHYTCRVLQTDAYVTGMIVAWLESDEGQAVWTGSTKTAQLELLRSERADLRNQADELAEMWQAREVTRAQFASMNRSLLERLSRAEGMLVRAGAGRAAGGVLMEAEQVVTEWRSADFGLARQRAVIGMAIETLEAKPRGKGVRGFDGDRDLIVRFYDEGPNPQAIRVGSF
jgi:site-specific DNA recombinase